MPEPLPWTAAQDARLRRLRAEGADWDHIAALLALSRCAAIERAGRIGACRPPPDFVPPAEDPERDPLPAGHPSAWGAITEGTLLAGMPYPLPVFIR
jgi:hypothetical protein